MAQALVLSFRKEVALVEASPEGMTLELPWGKAPLNGLSPGLLATLRTLSSGGATEEDLSDRMLETDGPAALASLYYHLQRYGELGLLCYTLVAAGQPLATVVPMTPGFQPCPPSIGPDTRFRLSRFAYCRREGDALVLESPLSLARTILPGSTGAALVAELAQPRAYPDLCARIAGLAEETAQAFLGLLANAALVAEVGDDGRLPEDDNPTLAQWAFHDLLFHARSRSGRHDYPMGGNFPFLGQIPPLPALKPQMSDDVIPLYKPEIAQLVQEDLPFTRVLETRRSVRDYGDEPITAQQLGEFLYRVARVRQVAEADPAHGRPYEVSNRPYPSGGATYDLELYVTVNRCEDIAPGLYHYHPLAHRLHKLAERNGRVEALLLDARRAVPLSGEPQVLITLASRFQRLSWKYSGLAYAVTLKNVGVLYQTMYLVATAMGLAPCGIGGGNPAVFAEAVGTDYFAESSVGEFLLGSARKRPMERGAAQPEERVTE
jgi:SagB-type dehydrogenase family enzyme